jgi:CP family cyanate transporter-like MFS transporter
VIELFAATAVMSAGVAISQPAMPALVGRWLPQNIALGTAVYTNGLLFGEILPVGLFPVLFPLVSESWRATFILWAVPIAAIAVLMLAFAPREAVTPALVAGTWWPRWRLLDIVRLGLVFGATNALYFASNAFIPGQLTEAGRPDLISPALTALNLGQLPASLLLIVFARRLERKGWPFILAGVLSLASIAIIVSTTGVSTVASAALLGFSAGGAFALGLTLPPLLSAQGEVARVSAAMFTVSYSGALVVSILSGAAWDLAGSARFAFLPIAISALPLLVLVPTIDFSRRPQSTPASQ